MFDFTKQENIDRMIDVATPAIKELLANPDIDGVPQVVGYEPTYMSVYTKTKELYLRRLLSKIGFEQESIVYDVVCEKGCLYKVFGADEALVNLEEYYVEDYCCPYDDFKSPGTFFWTDSWGFSGGGSEAPEDLVDYSFPGEGILDYMEIDNLLSLNYEEFKSDHKDAYESISLIWNKEDREEMTKEFYKDLQCMVEESLSCECDMSYYVNVNSAIRPFIDSLRINKELRSDKASKFALLLIRTMRWQQQYFPTAAADRMWGFTENYFYTTQALGTQYDASLLRVCLRLSADIAMRCIDYVLAYLDIKYKYLPDNVRKLYQTKEATN